MTWECISRSHDCKLDLVTIRENLTGDQNTRDILQPVVVPHFAKHPLACIYGWQRQAASLKGSDCQPSKWSHAFSSMASHEPGFESDEACLWHARLSCTGSWTSCAKLTSGIATVTRAVHPTTNWRDNTEVEAFIQAHGGCTRYWILNHYRWVTHNWCFPSGMIIVSYIMNC